MTPFQEKIAHVVRMIPAGNVMSYSQVASYIGAPRGAQVVGWILRSMEGKVDIPWWRVLNNAGRITIKGNRYNTPNLQKKMLEADRIIVSEDLTIAMGKYRYIPTPDQIQQMQLSEQYLDVVHKKGYL